MIGRQLFYENAIANEFFSFAIARVGKRRPKPPEWDRHDIKGVIPSLLVLPIGRITRTTGRWAWP